MIRYSDLINYIQYEDIFYYNSRLQKPMNILQGVSKYENSGNLSFWAFRAVAYVLYLSAPTDGIYDIGVNRRGALLQ